MVVVQKKEKKCCKQDMEVTYRGPRRPVYRMGQEPLPTVPMPKNCCETDCCKKKDKKPEKKKDDNWNGVSNFFGALSAPYRLKELGESG